MSLNVLIVGASSGIGLSLAEELCNQGHNVYGTYNLHPVQHEQIRYVACNVLEPKIEFDFLPDTLDAIVYCPGSIQLKPFSRFSAEDFRADYDLQVIGAVKCIQAVLPKLKQSKNASITLFSSIAASYGFTFHSLVSASKAAIEGLCKALAAELAPGIRVNCIAPSITQTPLAANLLNTPEKIETNAKRHPLKRVGSGDDIAQAAAFLLSENAKWISGQVIHVDGGLSTLKV